LVKIICIGNRFAYPDNFGMLVYDELKNINLEHIELIEGGVGGMSLLPYFEDEKKILIVDYAAKGMKKIMNNQDIADINISEYTHSNSFLYLLKSIKKQYTLYLCDEEFKQNNLSKYIKEILEVAEGL